MKKKFFYTWLLITLLKSGVYGQIASPVRADTLNNREDTFVTNFLHIPDQFSKWPERKILGFVLKNVDTTGTTKWKSEIISPLDKDEKGYVIKVDIPSKISKQFPTTWCSVIYIDPSRPKDTLTMQYGGVRAGEIKLKLKSSPNGAETFLVPNRTWILKIQSPDGKIDYETVERKYRVNGGPTEISAFVDETVYVVIYKMNGKYKTIVHYTKPRMVEPEQTVFVNF
jgi:hypothetical protein